MPLDKLNAALIAAIQNGTPEYTNPAAILTDKLNIGREAAYRRLRGEVPFTFGEAAVLWARSNFSLDRAVGAVDFGNVLFRRQLQRLPYGARRLHGRYGSGHPFLPGRRRRIRMRSRLLPETRSRGCFTCATKGLPISNSSSGFTQQGLVQIVRRLNSRI